MDSHGVPFLLWFRWFMLIFDLHSVSCVSPWAQVSFEDVDRLRALAQMENVRIPHFMQDQARYAEQLTKIMVVNQLTDEELKTII